MLLVSKGPLKGGPLSAQPQVPNFEQCSTFLTLLVKEGNVETKWLSFHVDPFGLIE
jgi:hypothetical protein